MGKLLNGSDITLHQIEGLIACLGAPDRAMIIQKQQLVEANLSDDEIDDLVAKGYLEMPSSGYLIPAMVEGQSLINKMCEKRNNKAIRQIEERDRVK